jgi:hypothetical protein
MQPNARASFSRDEEKFRNGLRWQSQLGCRLLTLHPYSRNAVSHSSFVSLLLALSEFPIMARDDSVAKPHIG